MDGRPVDFLCPPEDVQKGKEDNLLRTLDWYFISVDMNKQKKKLQIHAADVTYVVMENVGISGSMILSD